MKELILISAPLAVPALIACFRCHRPEVLVPIGGTALVFAAAVGLMAHSEGAKSSESWAPRLIALVSLPVGVAGLILLAGGAVRWALARGDRRSESGDADDPDGCEPMSGREQVIVVDGTPIVLGGDPIEVDPLRDE